MMVRNNWAHLSADFPSKDSIIEDLNVIKEFMTQLKVEETTQKDIEALIKDIECDNVNRVLDLPKVEVTSKKKKESNGADGQIQENDLVSICATPEKMGIVRTIKSLGAVIEYGVFVDGKIKNFYSGQISKVKEQDGAENIVWRGFIFLECCQNRFCAISIQTGSEIDSS